MKEEESGPQNRELYALLHISPEASDEEIRKAYRQWAQIYHPDKYQAPEMKEIATENFQRICEAYEILSDETKRQIYDIYGMEGINSGLELGTKLNKAEEIKEELERLRRQKELQKVAAHLRPSGSILATLSLPQFLEGDGIMKGMAMASEVQSQISKHSAVAIGGNLAVNGNAGGGAASVVFRHQMSSVSSIEFMGSMGLRALLGVQTTRHISAHSTATMGLAMSLRDGSVDLSNTWTRQLSDTAHGNIHLSLGPESSIAVGWQKKEQKRSASGEIKTLQNAAGCVLDLLEEVHCWRIRHDAVAVLESPSNIEFTSWPTTYFFLDKQNTHQLILGTGSFGANAHYTHRFSSKSHGRIAARIGSTALELELGGGRKVSEFSTIRMLYSVGIQGIFWKFELHRGGQKLIVPVLLSRHLNPVFATGAFVLPTSLYFVLKRFVVKPFYLKREKQKGSENMDKTLGQPVIRMFDKQLGFNHKLVEVREARAAAKKAQQLLQNVANRKRNKQLETGGLVVKKALYGSHKALKNINQIEEVKDEAASQIIDVTLPLNFLVSDSGQLKLHEGVKKSGIMGFCDPCPGEPKQLYVEYTFGGNNFEVIVDDLDELLIPQESHRT